MIGLGNETSFLVSNSTFSRTSTIPPVGLYMSVV